MGCYFSITFAVSAGSETSDLVTLCVCVCVCVCSCMCVHLCICVHSCIYEREGDFLCISMIFITN